MSDFETRNRYFDRLFNTPGLHWMGQNTNHLPLPGAVTQAMIDKYKAADAKNLPEFEKKMHKIVYDDATLEQFREVAGKPVWNKWVADNKDKFDAQGVLDRLWELVKEAKAM